MRPPSSGQWPSAAVAVGVLVAVLAAPGPTAPIPGLAFARQVRASTFDARSQTIPAEAPAGRQAAIQAKLTARDGAANDQFGFSVAISGPTAVVGAPFEDQNTGAAYVYTRSGTLWYQQAKLVASDGVAGDLFGIAVAISGSTAVVAAGGRPALRSAAFVFVRTGATWAQQAQLNASPEDSPFGLSVAIYGSVAFVGAFGKFSGVGTVYVFVRTGAEWSKQAQLYGDSFPFDSFGSSVAAWGSTLVVGAPGQGIFGPPGGGGAAYVFQSSGSTWTRQGRLTAADATSNDGFGSSVAIFRSNVVVGASGRNSGTGAAYVFVGSGTTWSQQAELTAADGGAGDAFGTSVAIVGPIALVGAYRNNSNRGAAYVFIRPATAWFQHAKLVAADGAQNDEFGFSVAAAGLTGVVGAPCSNSCTGAAYAFGPAAGSG